MSATTAASPRYGMVVDVNRCVGCQTCTIACKHTNDTPPGVQWRRVLDVEQGEFPDVERLFERAEIDGRHDVSRAPAPDDPSPGAAGRASRRSRA